MTTIVIPGGMAAFRAGVRKKRLVLPRRSGFTGARSGATPAAVTFVDAQVSTADAAEYTFPVTLAAGLHIIGIGGRDTATGLVFSAVTALGEAAASVVEILSGSDLNRTAFYQVDIPTGGSGNIVVTWNQTINRCGIGVWSTNGTVSDSDSSAADAPTATLTVSAGGAGIGYALAGDGTTPRTATWTNLDEDFDEAVETVITHSGASKQIPAGGNVAMTCTWSGTPSLGTGGVFVAIAPP